MPVRSSVNERFNEARALSAGSYGGLYIALGCASRFNEARALSAGSYLMRKENKHQASMLQ